MNETFTFTLCSVSRSLPGVEASDHAAVLFPVQRRTVGDPRPDPKSARSATAFGVRLLVVVADVLGCVVVVEEEGEEDDNIV